MVRKSKQSEDGQVKQERGKNIVGAGINVVRLGQI